MLSLLRSVFATRTQKFRAHRNLMLKGMQDAYEARKDKPTMLTFIRQAYHASLAAKSVTGAKMSFEEMATLANCVPYCEKQFCETLIAVIPPAEYQFLHSIRGWRQEMGWHDDRTAVADTVSVLEGVRLNLSYKTDDAIRELYGRNVRIPYQVRVAIFQCLDRKINRDDLDVFLTSCIFITQKWLPDLLVFWQLEAKKSAREMH